MNDRIVLPELLDGLPPQSAAALRSRRDLRRVNAWMRHPQIMARALRENFPAGEARRLVELGAGDGHFLLQVAKRTHGRWPGTQAILVDQLPALDPQTRAGFRRSGWQVCAETAEAAAWLRRPQPQTPQALISNLFFHHFESAGLGQLLRLAAGSSRLVIALEPRRSGLARMGARWLWAIGCGPVTRHDAHLSVRAGFVGSELSALWPDRSNWRLTEQRAGPFSHLFVARRKD